MNAPRSRPYRVPVQSVHFVREGAISVPCGDARQAESIARTYLADRPTESLILMAVDGHMRARAIVLVARGGISGCQVNIADVLRPALLAGRVGFVLAHNHPSGNPTPSPEDIAFTARVVEASTLVGLAMLDHVIVSEGGCCTWLGEPHRWQR